ncbi:MAG: hypothetical protein AB8B51_21260 [Sedimentitalea sp.]
MAQTANGGDASGAGMQGSSDHEHAPPSAMQRKIMEILEQQAKSLENP